MSKKDPFFVAICAFTFLTIQLFASNIDYSIIMEQPDLSIRISSDEQLNKYFNRFRRGPLVISLVYSVSDGLLKDRYWRKVPPKIKYSEEDLAIGKYMRKALITSGIEGLRVKDRKEFVFSLNLTGSYNPQLTKKYYALAAVRDDKKLYVTETVFFEWHGYVSEILEKFPRINMLPKQVVEVFEKELALIAEEEELEFLQDQQ